MNSTSPMHVRDAHVLGGVHWRESLLLVGVAVLAALVVAVGLGTAFGPCPPRQVKVISVPTLGPSGR